MGRNPRRATTQSDRAVGKECGGDARLQIVGENHEGKRHAIRRSDARPVFVVVFAGIAGATGPVPKPLSQRNSVAVDRCDGPLL